MKITTQTQMIQTGYKNQKNLSVNSNSKEDISKVERIKKEIENGTYKIDIQNTAEALSSHLLNLS